jgi:hypothetical protein
MIATARLMALLLFEFGNAAVSGKRDATVHDAETFERTTTKRRIMPLVVCPDTQTD